MSIPADVLLHVRRNAAWMEKVSHEHDEGF